MRLGPASHDPNYSLVERRADIGVMPIKENYYAPRAPEDEGFRMDLNPEKPRKNRLVFKYKLPTERKKDVPQKDEGRWVFYDVDLDAVRAELAKDVFMAGRMNQQEFKEREEFKRLLEEHIKRKTERRPEAGDYPLPLGMGDTLVGGTDFDKMLPRFTDDLLDDTADREGDVLILDPHKLGKHLPEINFDKQLGRPLAPIQEEDDYREELVLNPTDDLIKKRLVNFVDFSKQTGREEKKVDLDDDEYYIRPADDGPAVPYDPSQPREIAHDFGKGSERFPVKENLHEVEEPLILDVKYPGESRVKTTVDIGRQQERFREKLPEDPFYDDLPLNEFTNDLNKADAARRAETRGPNFGKQSAGDKNKDLRTVLEEQDAKDARIAKAKQSNKQKYTVKNNFTPKAKTNPVVKKP